MPAVRPGKTLLTHPREWGIGQYLLFLGVAAIIISVFLLEWVNVEVDFQDPFLGASWFKGNYHFKVLENEALTAIIVVILLALLALSIFRGKTVSWILPVLSLGLLGCFAYYLISLAGKAYDALGFLDSLLELMRKGIPIFGPSIADLTKQAVLNSIKSVRPQAGPFVFMGGDLLLLAASVLRLLRKPDPKPLAAPSPSPGVGTRTWAPPNH